MALSITSFGNWYAIWCSGPSSRLTRKLVRNLPQERLTLGVGAVAAAETVLAETLEYVRQRHALV
jgi:alkylation response protein AidB-like acyl-CoA dehydrogenase